MQVRSRLKAGGTDRNHNETLVRGQKHTQGLKVKTGLKCGRVAYVTNAITGTVS